MSRSNPTPNNPAVRFLQWSGGTEDKGKLTYWDKQAGERKTVELPFTFMVLDQLHTMGGFSDEDQSGYWSNEVRNLQEEDLIVRTRNGTKATGKYRDLGDVKSKGAKYAKSVYIAYKDEDTEQLVIGNIKLMGAALTAWIDFTRAFDVYKCGVTISGADEGKKGSVTYYIPKFDSHTVSRETNADAVVLDKELQQYLKTYLTEKRGTEEEAREAFDDFVPEDIEDNPEALEQMPPDFLKVDDDDSQAAKLVK
jgi:hypothetical protein